MDFTDPCIINGQAILIRVEDEGLTVDDFTSNGKKIAAQVNTTDAALAETLAGRDNVLAYDMFNAAILALQNGDVDGVVINGANAGAYEKEFAGKLVAGIRDVQADPLGLVFRKGDANVAAFNEGLAAIKADGTLDALIQKYWAAN